MRRAPVTTGIVALNVLVFAAMAFTEGWVLKLNQQVLLAWGADYGPRTLTDQWWRLLSHAFLHLDLAHLSVNMLFLMLAGPLAEKFLGAFRFAFVCLFAAVAAGLWMVGWFPAKVSLGASGAVYGVVGCFLGCAVRAPRTIPRLLFRRQVGLLVLFSLIFLLIDYLDRESAFIAHGGGLLYGFVGGLLLGPISASRGRSGKQLHPVFGALGCCALIIVTASVVERCAQPTVDLLVPYQTALDAERDLSERFHDALTQWDDGKMGNAEFRSVLETELIPRLAKLRKQSLGLPAELAGLEPERISLQKFMEAASMSRSRRAVKREERPASEEFDHSLRLCLKWQLDSWKSLSDELANGDSSGALALMDVVVVEVLRMHLDEIAEKHNALHNWLDFSRRKAHYK